MEKLNICIDIDGTITEPFYWMENLNGYFNQTIEPHQVTTYKIYELYNISKEAFMEYYEIYGEEMHRNAKIRKDSSCYINKLAEEHNVYFITARMPLMEKVTREWFEKHGLPQSRIFFLGSHDKLDKAQELNCDIFIEDRYENALQLSEGGIYVLLIDCEYNRKPLNDLIKRVYAWSEINKEINQFEKVVVE